MTSERRTLLALFSIAFGLRILYAVLIGTQPEITITSSVNYAKEITSGLDWIKNPYSPAAPGYPFLLAGTFLLTGGRIWAGIILQAILGALTVVIVFRLGEKLGGRITGLFAAIWLSLFIHHIHHVSILNRSILASLLLVLLLHLLSKPFEKMRYAIISGLVYTALLFVDPQYILLFPAVAIFILIWATKHALLNLHYFFLFAGSVIVLSLPWTIRNHLVYSQPIPVSLESARYIQPFFGVQKEAKSESIGEIQRSSRIDRFGYNTFEFWRVVRFKGEDPSSQGLSPGRPPKKAWSLRHNLINLISYGLLLPFFIIGIFFTIRERNRAGISITVATLFCFLIRVFFGGSEFARLPIEPFIILLAFYGLFRFLYALQKKPAPH